MNPRPKPLDNTPPFHDLRRRDHIGRTSTVRPVLIEHRGIRGDRGQCLELPVGDIFQDGQRSLELLLALSVLSALIGPLGGHDGQHGGVGPVHGVLDDGRETADADPPVFEDLTLVGRRNNGAGLGVFGLILVVEVVVVWRRVILVVVFVYLVLLPAVDLGLSLSLLPSGPSF